MTGLANEKQERRGATEELSSDITLRRAALVSSPQNVIPNPQADGEGSPLFLLTRRQLQEQNLIPIAIGIGLAFAHPLAGVPYSNPST